MMVGREGSLRKEGTGDWGGADLTNVFRIVQGQSEFLDGGKERSGSGHSGCFLRGSNGLRKGDITAVRTCVWQD